MIVSRNERLLWELEVGYRSLYSSGDVVRAANAALVAEWTPGISAGNVQPFLSLAAGPYLWFMSTQESQAELSNISIFKPSGEGLGLMTGLGVNVLDHGRAVGTFTIRVHPVSSFEDAWSFGECLFLIRFK
jgi:hypothetical protein